MFSRTIINQPSRRVNTDYGKASRERLINFRRFRNLSIMPTIKEEEEQCKPITYSEKFGIRFCLPDRTSTNNNKNDDEDEKENAYDDIYEEILISFAKTRNAFNGRQEKRCAGKLEDTKIFAQELKKTAKFIDTCAGLATCTGLATCAGLYTEDTKKRSSPKPTKSDLRFTTNKLSVNRAYKIQQACACICDRVILKSVGCNCI